LAAWAEPDRRGFLRFFLSKIFVRIFVFFVLVFSFARTPALASPLQPLVDKLPFELDGFLEGAAAIRTREDPLQENDFDLGELRLQLEASKILDWAEFKYRGDFLYDAALQKSDFDLREANLIASPLDFLDMKVGRQILTWGTGDLIFLNDLFPKDVQSFFIGRDVNYLKAPSDAAKFSFFLEAFNIDLVWTPRFNSDRFLTGERLSFFNPAAGTKIGKNNRVNFIKPADWVKDSELALRIYKNIRGVELALYGYRGFFKDPAGVNASRQATFPALAVYGASARGEILGGIGSAELAYRDSLDDRGGTDPNIENSQLRLLFGLTREIVTNFTAGLQYNLERNLDFDALRKSLPQGAVLKDENRHLVTLRLTQLLFLQKLKLSLFTFYSPSDEDAYFRPSLFYEVNDNLTFSLGGNIFLSKKNHTFFGQLQDNTTGYLRIRYSF